MMSSSEFCTDGYNDALAGHPPSPPGVPVLASEYIEGYQRGRWLIQAAPKLLESCQELLSEMKVWAKDHDIAKKAGVAIDLATHGRVLEDGER